MTTDYYDQLSEKNRGIVNQTIGMEKAAAIELIEKNDMHVFIAQEDDLRFFKTTDLDFTRANLVIKNGKITDADVG